MIASNAEATYYDSTGNQVVESSGTYYLADTDGSVLTVTANNVTATETVVIDGTSYTDYHDVDDAGTTYYVNGTVAGYYVVCSTTLCASNVIIYDGGYYYLVEASPYTATASADSTGSGAYITAVSQATSSGGNTPYTVSSSTAIGDGTAYYYVKGNVLYYVTFTSAAHDSDTTFTSVSGLEDGDYVYVSSATYLVTVSSVSDLSGYAATTSTTALYSSISYSAYATVSGSAALYSILDKVTLLTDSSSSEFTGTISTTGLYSGYNFAYDSSGNWLTSEDGTSFYLATDDAAIASASSLTTVYAYTLNGTTYYGEESGTAYTNFVSEVDDSKTTYGADGLLTDEDGYVIDTKGNQQTVEVETVYVYAVSGDEWNEADGYTGNTVTYLLLLRLRQRLGLRQFRHAGG